MAEDLYPLDLSWVTPHLSVGGRYPREAADALAQQEIRHVIDLRLEAADDERVLRQLGISLLHLPTADARPLSLPLIRKGVSWARPPLMANQKVFIHCQNGIGRSPVMTCCALVSLGHSPTEALSRVKRARPQAAPSLEQLATFLAWATEWRQQNGLAWVVPTVDDLSLIAYMHLASLR